MRKGTLYVFTGPSGAGKGTVLSRLLSEDEKLFFSISATTRAPRPGEKDGVQYYFLTKEDFEAKIAANAFLEHAKYVDNYYGTLEAPVNEKLEEGCDVILEIEVQGAMQVHEKRPDAVMCSLRRRRSRNLRTVCADAAPRTKPRCRSVWKRRRANSRSRINSITSS